MSDAAKSPSEIEDVLSSVRRLVTDHPTAESDATPASDKLVLTPALRVSEPEDPWSPVVASGDEDASLEIEASTDAGTPSSVTQTDVTFSPHDRLSDWGTVADSGGAFAKAHDELATMLDSSQGDATGFEPETGDEDWPDAGADGALRHIVAVRGGQADDEKPMDAGEDTAVFEDAEHEDNPTDLIHSDEGTSADAFNDDATADTDHDDPVEVDEAELATPIFSRIRSVDDADAAPGVEVNAEDADTDLESKLADIAAAAMAEAPSDGEESAMAADPLDDAEAAETTDEDAVDDLGDEPWSFTFPEEDEDGILDEATLREIIVDVVREELQGALGQRITRNVRKMVRREIRLALAAEDLE